MLAGAGGASALPPGFQETTAFSGLDDPTVVRFADDGRVFVAEHSGLIKEFSDLGDNSPQVVADLRRQVYGFWDRGLLGFALDPDFVANQRVYVLYAHDAPIGGTAPFWGSLTSPGADPCPTPPGPTTDGCVISGRLSRLTLDGTPSPDEDVLIEDWCQQYPSHSVGHLEFDDSGALYASGGDGASFTFVDFGQEGNPDNPCGDPPGGVGGTMSPPTAQGGALRSQDLRTTSDPVTLDGSVIRIDPDTGDALPTNPNFGSSSPNARRIIAYGLRNPFRFAISPDDELWVGDVGWTEWEELNHLPTDPPSVVNFGWPCYEGAGRQDGYDAANLSTCENLYGSPVAHTPPSFAYHHNSSVVPGESCPTGSSSVAGVEFYGGGPYPAEYDDALFFADYSRDCIWVMQAGAGGAPNPADVSTFVANAQNPTFIESGPDGAVYYTDFDGGRVRRLSYSASNQTPTAIAAGTPTSGSAPLTVTFSGALSSDPDPGDTLDYAWDLDGDSQFDDSSSVSPQWTYTSPATVFVRLRVTDDAGATGTSESLRIDVGNDPPSAAIVQPTAGFQWGVGETINFAATASDPQQGALPPSAFDWELVINHCPSNCHQHAVQGFENVASGSFAAPDHEYPSTLDLSVTATDAQGLTAGDTVRISPETVRLTVASTPPGLELAINDASGPAPLSRTVIRGSRNTVGAPTPQQLGGITYDWESWSDGEEPTHTISADATTTYSALFSPVGLPSPSPSAAPPADPELKLTRLKLRIPDSNRRLAARGARAKLLCNLDCRATMKLVAAGRAARKLGIDGKIAKEIANLDAGEPTWVVAKLSRRAARLLRQAGGAAQPTIRANFRAR